MQWAAELARGIWQNFLQKTGGPSNDNNGRAIAAAVIQVFQACGQPTLGGFRGRRKASCVGRTCDEQALRSSHTASSEGLDSLVHDIRERLLTTRSFWKNLPDSVCSQLAAAPFELTNCWNGRRVSRSRLLFAF